MLGFLKKRRKRRKKVSLLLMRPRKVGNQRSLCICVFVTKNIVIIVFLEQWDRHLRVESVLRLAEPIDGLTDILH
ncbi:hypothetical protein HanRHA438_Chr16g0756241 [Helianthus annuus]|uniref:Uncharacterized protein n=1 Tax=Helianthus annuus TaxID=4232 RepID=A0A9K3DRH2_HELAN|nr:hypothetical protein HanXRQr2_Chr16g0744411 [Helianthus annuus]KAJ0442423.1 hypothetical protein HanIR_Chr16g0809111 [Helianthus annuus]KAJ0820916.1 hypothetical protein HanPSC8_Chr16g0713761 [Helianthus annuus]KAJ0835520.1 hypothetical protein HanRHA438_Chr16g0756241 [Helianthus annuus]